MSWKEFENQVYSTFIFLEQNIKENYIQLGDIINMTAEHNKEMAVKMWKRLIQLHVEDTKVHPFLFDQLPKSLLDVFSQEELYDVVYKEELLRTGIFKKAAISFTVESFPIGMFAHFVLKEKLEEYYVISQMITENPHFNLSYDTLTYRIFRRITTMDINKISKMTDNLYYSLIMQAKVMGGKERENTPERAKAEMEIIDMMLQYQYDPKEMDDFTPFATHSIDEFKQYFDGEITFDNLFLPAGEKPKKSPKEPKKSVEEPKKNKEEEVGNALAYLEYYIDDEDILPWNSSNWGNLPYVPQKPEHERVAHSLAEIVYTQRFIEKAIEVAPEYIACYKEDEDPLLQLMLCACELGMDTLIPIWKAMLEMDDEENIAFDFLYQGILIFAAQEIGTAEFYHGILQDEDLLNRFFYKETHLKRSPLPCHRIIGYYIMTGQYVTALSLLTLLQANPDYEERKGFIISNIIVYIGTVLKDVPGAFTIQTYHYLLTLAKSITDNRIRLFTLTCILDTVGSYLKLPQFSHLFPQQYHEELMVHNERWTKKDMKKTNVEYMPYEDIGRDPISAEENYYYCFEYVEEEEDEELPFDEE